MLAIIYNININNTSCPGGGKPGDEDRGLLLPHRGPQPHHGRLHYTTPYHTILYYGLSLARVRPRGVWAN